MNPEDTRETVLTILQAARDLRAEDLRDPRDRASLHETRKHLDGLLEQAERKHHPCRS